MRRGARGGGRRPPLLLALVGLLLLLINVVESSNLNELSARLPPHRDLLVVQVGAFPEVGRALRAAEAALRAAPRKDEEEDARDFNVTRAMDELLHASSSYALTSILMWKQWCDAMRHAYVFVDTSAARGLQHFPLLSQSREEMKFAQFWAKFPGYIFAHDLASMLEFERILLIDTDVLPLATTLAEWLSNRTDFAPGEAQVVAAPDMRNGFWGRDDGFSYLHALAPNNGGGVYRTLNSGTLLLRAKLGDESRAFLRDWWMLATGFPSLEESRKCQLTFRIKWSATEAEKPASLSKEETQAVLRRVLRGADLRLLEGKTRLELQLEGNGAAVKIFNIARPFTLEMGHSLLELHKHRLARRLSLELGLPPTAELAEPSVERLCEKDFLGMSFPFDNERVEYLFYLADMKQSTKYVRPFNRPLACVTKSFTNEPERCRGALMEHACWPQPKFPNFVPHFQRFRDQVVKRMKRSTESELTRVLYQGLTSLTLGPRERLGNTTERQLNALLGRDDGFEILSL